MKAQGVDIINLGVGEPNWQTPDHVKQAAIKAIQDGFTRYTASEGILELRQAISEKFKNDNNLDYQPSQIVVSNGGKHVLHNILQCLCNPGDEVVIPTPYWVTYPPLVLLAGGTPVFVPTLKEDGYLLTPQALSRALTPKTKGLILNSPSNPTGMVYSTEDLQALGKVLLDWDGWIISDDIYEKLTYEPYAFTNLAMACPRLKERIAIVHGVSKTYAMTGWRIGFMAASEPLAKAATKLQSHMTSNPNSIAQKAALAALTGPQEVAKRMKDAFRQNRDVALNILSKMPRVSCPAPQGAFYLFPDVSEHFGRVISGVEVKNSDDLASVLLSECKVATVPGSGFGQPRAIRLSYATSEEDIRTGLNRLGELLSQ
jgi:aspartate aminotransferase